MDITNELKLKCIELAITQEQNIATRTGRAILGIAYDFYQADLSYGAAMRKGKSPVADNPSKQD